MDAVIKKLVLLCLVYPFAVHAQVAAPERTKNTIEEIIVSATKRDQSVRDIPISIDAFKGEDLENRGATNLEEIIKYSAGVTLQKGDRADNSSFTIRGIGGNTYYFSRTYGLFFSDVSLVNPTLQGVVPDIDPFDIASVEVLKGPQGTLFGGSSLAGAVRYVPTRPDFEDSYGSVSAGMGTMEDSEEIVEEYTLMLNAPLTSNFAVRGAGSVRHTPGYIDDHRFQKQDDTNAGDISSFRVMADWAISENLTLETTYLRRDSNTEQLGYIDNLEKRRETDSKTANESGNSDIEIFIGSLTWTGFEDFDLKLILAQLDKDSIQDYDFTAFFSYQNTGLRARVDDYISSTDQPSVELRMVSKDISSSDWWIMDGWQYVLGYYQQESDQINQFAYILGEPDPNFIEDDLGLGDIIDIPELTGPGLFADIFATAEEKALYFDLTKDMLDGKLQLGLGGR